MRQPAPSFRLFSVSGAAAVLTAMLILGGCDPSVTVLNPSDQYRFSLFGTLNVSADTQVIRVEPLGDTTQVGAPEDLNATVLLENVRTGTQAAFTDSFESVGEGSARFHNFRTTHSIQPDTKYRVSVLVDGEPVTMATTTTPARPPTLRHRPRAADDAPFLLPCRTDPLGELIESENTFTVRASAVESIAGVTVRYPITPSIRVNHYEDVEYVEEDLYRISVFYGRDLSLDTPQGEVCPTRSQFARSHAVVEVTAGGPGWPDWRDAPLNEIARPDTFTNVQGGHGFVGGIYSDTIHVPIRQRE